MKTLTIIFCFLLFSCSEKTDIRDIEKNRERLSTRIDRLRTMISDFYEKYTVDNHPRFVWKVEEFENMYNRLDSQLDDLNFTDENADELSEEQIVEARMLIDELLADSDSLIEQSEEIVKGVDTSKTQEYSMDSKKFIEEASRFKEELLILKNAVIKLNSKENELELEQPDEK